ncbi:MAG: hypothetical protein RLZZ192_549 [Pseudomonadota bacterium]
MAPKLPLDNAQTAGQFIQATHGDADAKQYGDSYHLAFADHAFLSRPEVRGIRFELELLKPDLALRERSIDHTIVVFGSARFISKAAAEQLVAQASDDNARLRANTALENSAHYESAREFGRLVASYNKAQSEAHHRLHICTGGGPGVMEAANRGAFESGDLTIGLNISLPREQNPNPYITPGLAFRFHYFALRKMHFVMRARAIVVYPGGFGSFDELFEVLTLIQTKKIEPLPVVLVGTQHWQTVVRFDLLVNQELIDMDDLKIVHFVDTAADAWSIIRDWYELG